MSVGRIFIAEHKGCYLLKFLGDIRLTLSAVLEDYINKVFADPRFVSVSVDLNQADALDSTSLGILAKLAIQMNTEYKVRPLLFSLNEDVTTILLRMGLDEVFQIKNQTSDSQTCDLLLAELKEAENEVKAGRAEESEESMRLRVLEAHKTLMGLNEKNRLAFSELVQVLE